MLKATTHVFDVLNLEGEGAHCLNYYSWGEEQSHKVAVCVHGMTRNGRDFDYLANALVAEGYYVLALDVSGRGLSDHLADPVQYGYPLYCADVTAWLESLDLRHVNYIGTSMGGLMGMMLAASDAMRKPKDKLISKLIINDIGPFIPKESLMRIGKYIGQKMVFDSADEAEEHYRTIMQPFGVESDEHMRHLISYAFKRDGDKTRFVYDEHIKNAFWLKNGKQRKLPDLDLWEMWRAISVSTYVIRGADSDLLLKQTYDEMLKSDFVIDGVEFANVGHAPMLMSDEQISKVVGFIS